MRQQVEKFLAEHDPAAEEPLDLLRSRSDAALVGLVDLTVGETR